MTRPNVSFLCPELLARIFMFACGDKLVIDGFHVPFQHQLGAVCRYWRNVAFHSSRPIWSSIHIDSIDGKAYTPDRRKYMLYLLKRAIRHSGQAPLDITLVCDYEKGCSFRDGFGERTGRGDPFIQKLASVSRRWRRFALTVTGCVYLPHSDELGLGLLLPIAHNVPLLEEVRFDVQHPWCDLESITNIFRDAPLLVRASGFTLWEDHFNLPWAQLRQLDVFIDRENLAYSHYSALNGATRLLKLRLMHSDRITHARISSSAHISSPSAGDIVHIPSVLELDTDCDSMLSRLSLPNLQTLRLRGDTIDDIEPVEHLLSQSACEVQTLSLYQTRFISKMTFKALIQLVKPSVRHLEVVRDRSLGGVMDALESPESFPKLESLCFSAYRWTAKDLPRLAEWIQRHGSRFPSVLKRVLINLMDTYADESSSEFYQEHIKRRLLSPSNRVFAALQACESPAVSICRVRARK
ncbi:hypothetical protein CYLTODRAFT_474810, partial [Cylindrobasidium torrendii FP15055 ss-10]